MRAADGKAALRSLRAARRKPPCVILLDVHMPVMDGWEFRKQQLRDSALAMIPVVMFTADHDRARAHELGVSEFLQKPADVDAVLAAVERYCEQRTS